MPLTARFDQDAESLEVVVNDLRPPKEFLKSPLPEVDPSVADAVRHALLLQRYGGPAADVEFTHGRGGRRNPPGVAVPTANYAVEAWLDARTGFGVVDQWRAALDKTETDSRLRELLLLDGQDLRAIFQRREGCAAISLRKNWDWHLGEEQ